MITTLIITSIYLYNYACYITLAFGANKECLDITEYLNYQNIYFLFNRLKIPNNCGFVRLVHILLNNKNIKYINEQIELVKRDNMPVIVSKSNTYFFDKVIVACDYNNYSSFLQLTKQEKKYLSDVESFKFYTTIVKFKKDKANIIESLPNVLGHYKYNKDEEVYLFGSHEPLNIDDTIYITKKEYVWNMPIVKNNKNKTLLNLEPNRNVYFIGKEIAGSGVNHCLKYSKFIAELI